MEAKAVQLQRDVGRRPAAAAAGESDGESS